jgi:hypothetical protein
VIAAQFCLSSAQFRDGVLLETCFTSAVHCSNCQQLHAHVPTSIARVPIDRTCSKVRIVKRNSCGDVKLVVVSDSAAVFAPYLAPATSIHSHTHALASRHRASIQPSPVDTRPCASTINLAGREEPCSEPKQPNQVAYGAPRLFACFCRLATATVNAVAHPIQAGALLGHTKTHH